MLLSNTFENIGRILSGRKFSFKSFLPFLCIGVTSAIFKQDRNEDDLKELLMFVHKKSANMSMCFLIILIGMSECWETLFLSSLNMSFFMTSMLISEK